MNLSSVTFRTVEVHLLVLAYLEAGLREILGQEFVKIRVISLEVFTGVHPVVLSVRSFHLRIHVEPVLDAFSPILRDISLGICVRVLAFGNCVVKHGLELVVH